MSDIFDPFGEFDDLENPSYTYLMEELHRQSKVLAMNNVYKAIISNKTEINITNHYEISILIERLLFWFEEREEYEKCLKLKKYRDKYVNN